MITGISLFDLIIIVGIIQGMVTATLLMLSGRNRSSNPYLALAIVLFCLLSVKILLHSLGLNQTPQFRYFPLGIELGIAPLIYLYCVSLITPGFRFNRWHLLHFIPFLLSQSYAFVVYFSVSHLDLIADKDVIGARFRFNQIKQIEDYLAVVSIAAYLYAGFFKLMQYRQKLRDTISDSSFPTFGWLLRIFMLSALLGVFLLANLSLDLLIDLKQITDLHWQTYFLYITCLIYYLGFAGYIQPQFDIRGLDRVAVEKGDDSALPNEMSDRLIVAIGQALERDEVYLDPTLTARDLADALGVSQSALSRTVNQGFGKTFRDLINEHRIEAVKQALLNQEHQRISVLGVALACGFNSEASFYRVFKKHTGVSPTQFCDQHQR